MFKKLIKIIIVLLCMIIIFRFSNDNGTQSNKKSDDIILNICNIFVHRDLSGKEKERIINKYVLFVRKSAHFIIYFVLGLSLISLIKEYRTINLISVLIALIIAILYACSDEIHQIFIPGRSAKILDVFIDSFGSFTGMYLYYVVYKIRRKKYE